MTNWYDSIVNGIKNALDAVYAKKTDLTSKADKVNGSNQITDTTSTFSHLGTLTDYKQSTINQAIDTAIGNAGGVSLNDIIKHFRYITITSSNISGTTIKTVTYTDSFGSISTGDFVLIYNNSGENLSNAVLWNLNDTTNSILVCINTQQTFYNGEYALVLRVSGQLYYAFSLTNAITPVIRNLEAYNNIKAGESSSLTMTNQKLINDAINTKFGTFDEMEVLITYTDSTTETVTLFKEV